MYHSLLLESIDPKGALPADMYIKVSNKFLKFKDKGEELTSDKYIQFIKGGMKLVYFSENDSQVVAGWIKENAKKNVKAVVEKAGVKFEKTANLNEASKGALSDVIMDGDPTADHFSNLSNSSSDFVSEAISNPMTGQAINALLDGAGGIAAHSINVANLSIYLAMELGNKEKKTLNSIYLGAIMHDFGKIRAKSEVLNSFALNNIADDHAEKGLAVVKKSEGLDPLILDIIHCHHEQFDGGGYPRGIEGDELKLECQIVAVANYFDQNLRLTEETPEDYMKVITEINSGNMTLFAPKLFPTVTKALKKAFIK